MTNGPVVPEGISSDPQPIRDPKVAPREEREFDQTFLSAEQHGRMVHRDYAAHFFRWGFATRRLVEGGIKGAKVLDIGCGPEVPLMRVLFGSVPPVPDLYVGVDLNKIKKVPNSERRIVLPEFNFVERWKELAPKAPFNLITCFEVIEHMTPISGAALLYAAGQLMDEHSTFLLSTPNFTHHAARNHVHEFTIAELQAMIEANGLTVWRRFGTFMDMTKVRQVATPAQIALVQELKAYYSDTVLSTFLAPLYPDASKNNMWVLKKKIG